MRIFAIAVLAAVLWGCGSTPVQEPRTYDLGLSAPSAPLPAVRLGRVRAIPPFDGTEMHYRLSFRNAAEIAPFATSAWAASPADLLRKQLLRGTGESAGRCLLDLEIHEFTQVFSSEKASEARLELSALLSFPSGAVSRTLTVSEPNAGADAAAGAGAMARAADRAIAELGRWISTQASCN